MIGPTAFYFSCGRARLVLSDYCRVVKGYTGRRGLLKIGDWREGVGNT